MSFPWLALASLAAWALRQNRSHDRTTQETDRNKDADPCEDYTGRRKCLLINIRAKLPVMKCLNAHQSSALADGPGK
jgi:hypothetical protein